MRVNQTIRIGSITVNTMTSSSILQIGSSGAIKARAEVITEQVTEQQAHEILENKIHQELEPILKQEGLPVATENGTSGNGQNKRRDRT
ncbi:hypothetical protein CIG75_16445 [Tumebacillus algifaecis]|uniref:Uncharacterized protein n=1 Tax=Tumebacillus algifaecis TaxID=1214604 RepID=A0A223D4M9_9BACL|nr:spore germination protein GerPB [Tumebacillus algifaecis]ASS76386.1 hypothetical protein CIG75_16445 [Tumebacillus algifaecis]